ncbi:AEC family transporter [Caldilinea sp.]|uniref:AEC family transporter n=1 Tax=Caldilinea sp. TaxID=2293560 RepID=UPI0021DBDD8A|nr:AEC family transporter [Caldilinea sp.]GIV71304.1 MAG: transporter [Caldilinea sp.]
MTLLANLASVFASTVLPVFLVAGAGYALARFMSLEGRTLGRVVFYLASPALVFRSLYNMDISTTALMQVLMLVLGVYLVTGFAGWVAGLDQERQRRSALTIASAISNNGNMGLPITLFALGQAGLTIATIYYAISALLTNTLGVFIASSGSAPLGKALRQSLHAPVVYASLLGVILNRLAAPIPEPLYRALDLTAGAAIPMMLVLLGVQLRATPINREQRVIWRSMAIRLGLSPLAALALCALLGIDGLERQVMILQASMPTAVVATVLATEFVAAPHLVAAAVLFSTLASMATISLVLVWIA